MDQEDVRIGTACMNEIMEVLKKHGCALDVVVSFSSIRGTSFQIVAIPQKNVVIANQMPKIKIGDN